MASESSRFLAFAITPVQGFLRESRKAQDYWCSSLILAGMTRAALRYWEDSGCTALDLVYPQSAGAADATPRATNEGLARLALHLDDPAAARDLAEQAADAAITWWQAINQKVRERLIEANLFKQDELQGWKAQADSQFDAAWAVSDPFDPEDEQSRLHASHQIHALLNAAKRSRPLRPYTGDSREKCTLCGQWEQMGPIAPPGEARNHWAHMLRSRIPGARARDRTAALVMQARIEREGRERLCGVCLTRRLAPALAPALAWHGRGDVGEGRFPSTASVARYGHKAALVERAADAAAAGDDGLWWAMRGFVGAARRFAMATGEPLGNHDLPGDEVLLARARDRLGPPADLRRFVRMDGSWLDDPEGRPEVPPKAHEAYEGLKAAHRALRKALRDVESPVAIDRAPPVALIRADADRLGRTFGEVLETHGLASASELSRELSGPVMDAAIGEVARVHGRVVFAGGDELVALLPAAAALEAARGVVAAYRAAGAALDPRPPWAGTIGCSLAIVVCATDRPLRLALRELADLLEAAKEYRRPDLNDPHAAPTTRNALGLAVIPGSGNVRRGVVGLDLPTLTADPSGRVVRTDPRRDALGEVLIPLAGALAMPEFGVSPKLFRYWVDLFDRLWFRPDREVRGEDYGDFRSLLDVGMLRLHARRLGLRHIQVDRAGLPLADDARAAFRALADRDPRHDEKRDELATALAEGIADRLETLAASGWESDQWMRWSNLKGLVLALTSLGTRELR